MYLKVVSNPKTKLKATEAVLFYAAPYNQEIALFPDLSHFCSLVCVILVHGSGRATKNGEGLGTLIT